MNLYKPKQSIVEALQVFDTRQVPEGLAKEVERGNIRRAQTGALLIDTIEGTLAILPGDWVVRDQEGRLLLCPGEHFHELYEKVEL